MISQLSSFRSWRFWCCILSKFYIKPQLTGRTLNGFDVVSYRNSTSNHNRRHSDIQCPHVVSYRNSTSNHNLCRRPVGVLRVVSYRNSTSNHNCASSASLLIVLYLIEILHQTTTFRSREAYQLCCILSKFYIKPQPVIANISAADGCILSKFYIKPQQRVRHKIGHSVVSYRNSTSNHNNLKPVLRSPSVVSYRNSTSNHNQPFISHVVNGLYLIEILHQTTTLWPWEAYQLCCILSKFYIKPQPDRQAWYRSLCCILSKFYIKPQHECSPPVEISVVSYRNSTSNHNVGTLPFSTLGLYLIEILHQTTTMNVFAVRFDGCILSKFYIKPQQLNWEKEVPVVVSYRNSTSNHNVARVMNPGVKVVSYRNSTSNHNFRNSLWIFFPVVSYRNSTSNHNLPATPERRPYVVSYRNSTSNHNNVSRKLACGTLYLIEILHQTTTHPQLFKVHMICIL